MPNEIDAIPLRTDPESIDRAMAEFFETVSLDEPPSDYMEGTGEEPDDERTGEVAEATPSLHEARRGKVDSDMAAIEAGWRERRLAYERGEIAAPEGPDPFLSENEPAEE